METFIVTCEGNEDFPGLESIWPKKTELHKEEAQVNKIRLGFFQYVPAVSAHLLFLAGIVRGQKQEAAYEVGLRNGQSDMLILSRNTLSPQSSR